MKFKKHIELYNSVKDSLFHEDKKWCPAWLFLDIEILCNLLLTQLHYTGSLDLM